MVKSAINQWNTSFNQGNVTQYRELQKQVKRKLKLTKHNYKNKIEGKLSYGNSRPVWEGVKSMMGLQINKRPISFKGKTDVKLSKDLNSFYNLFNVRVLEGSKQFLTTLFLACTVWR